MVPNIILSSVLQSIIHLSSISYPSKASEEPRIVLPYIRASACFCLHTTTNMNRRHNHTSPIVIIRQVINKSMNMNFVCQILKINGIHSLAYDMEMPVNFWHHIIDKPLYSLNISKERYTNKKIINRPRFPSKPLSYLLSSYQKCHEMT